MGLNHIVHHLQNLTAQIYSSFTDKAQQNSGKLHIAGLCVSVWDECGEDPFGPHGHKTLIVL